MFKNTIVGLLGDIQPLYQALIASNGELRQSILKTQTALASQFRIFGQGGDEITDVAEKITATETTIREAILRLERETRELSGVTTADTVEAFNIVVSEGGRFLQNQLGDYESSIDASIDITKGLVAALGSLNLPLQQARQEFRAFVQGDLKNPDAQIIKALGIDEATFRQAEREGRLAEFIRDSFAPATEANKIASESITGALSNIQDVFENAGRISGERLTAELTKTFLGIQDFLFENEEQINRIAQSAGDDLATAFTGARQIIQGALEVIGPFLTPIAETVGQILSLTADGIGRIGRLVEGLRTGAIDLEDLFVTDLGRGLFRFGEQIIEIADNITQALLGIPIGELASQLARFAAPITVIGDRIGQARNVFAQFNGNLRESQETLQANANTFGILSNQVDLYSQKLAEAEAAQDEEAATRYRTTLGELQQELAALGETTEDVATFNQQDAATRDELTQSIEDQKDAIRELGVVADGVDFQSLALPQFGDTVEELEAQLNRAFEQIRTGAGGSAQVFAQNQEEALRLISTLRELGQITVEDAVSQLQELQGLAESTPEQRLEIERQIVGLIEQGARDRQAALQREQQETATLLAQGQINAGEAAIRNLETQRNEVQEQLQDAQQRLAALQVAGVSTQQIKDVQTEVETLNSQLLELDATATSLALEEEISKAESAFARLNAEIDRATAERELSIRQSNADIATATANSQAQLAQREAEFQQELIESEQRANQQRIENLQSRIQAQQSALASANDEQRKDIQQELDDLQGSLAEAQIQTLQLEQEVTGIQANIARAQQQAIDERIEIARQGAQEQELIEQISQQSRINALELTNEQIAESEATAARERAENARRFAQERLEALQDIPIPEDEAARLDLERNVRAATIERYQTELELLEAVGRENAVIRDNQRQAIDEQIQLLRESSEFDQQRFALQQRQSQLTIQSLAREANFAQTRFRLEQDLIALQRTSVDLRIQELNTGEGILRNLREGENIGKNERRLLQQRLRELGLAGQTELGIARARLRQIQEQNDLEQQALDLKQQAEQETLRLKQQQEASQQRLAIAEQRQALVRQQLLQRELQLELQKAQLIDDPEVRARTIANVQERLDIQQESLQVARQSLAEAQAQLETTQQQQQLEQQALQARQDAELARARAQQRNNEFEAELQVARAQDARSAARQVGDSPQSRGRTRQSGSFSAGSVEDIAAASQVQNTSTVNNITNNFNAPLANASLARSLGT